MRADSLGFPLTFDVAGRPVLIIGDAGDVDGAKKRALLEAAGAQVRALAPDDFTDADCDGACLVLVVKRDPAVAARVAAAARARGVLVWCSDDPGRSDVAMPAIARLGPLTIAIATAGASPSLASRLRALLEERLGAPFARFVTALGERRRAGDLASRRADLDGLELELRVRYPDWFDEG
jgi:precorrin-2 dehydrogenase/sirohydrochlorin ferrochelatase